MNNPATTPRHGPSVERVEEMLGNLLRLGVILSFLVIIIGIAITVIHHPDYLTDASLTPKVIGAGNAFPSTIGGLLSGLRAFQGRSIIILGIMLLILTPVFRVIASIIAFSLQRDWLYTLLTMGVLAVLVISFVIGKSE